MPEDELIPPDSCEMFPTVNKYKLVVYMKIVLFLSVVLKWFWVNESELAKVTGKQIQHSLVLTR